MKIALECQYNYEVVPIGEDGEEAYKAVVPKFPGMLVMADDVTTLHEMVIETIKVEIYYRKKEGTPIPDPDMKTGFNGKVLLRMKPKIHKKLFYEAKSKNISLNKYIESILSSAI